MSAVELLLPMYTFGPDDELIEVKESKTATPRILPVSEIENFAFITANKARIGGIVIDVDDVEEDESGFLPGFDEGTYEWAGAPLPARVVSTSGQRFQAQYPLHRPLPLRKNASGKSFDFFRDVRDSLTVALNGDLAVPYRGTVRNPLFRHAKVIDFHQTAFHLADIQAATKLDGRMFERWSREYRQGNRNRATFLFALDEFKTSGDTLSPEALIAKIQTFQALHTSVPALGLGEISRIASSVLRNGSRYHRPGRRYEPHWKVGALGLPSANWAGMTPNERRTEIRYRQGVGALHCHEVRKAATLAKLQVALDDMVKSGVPPSKAALARKTGVKRDTVARHWTALTGEV